jgi:hypothetical protein
MVQHLLVYSGLAAAIALLAISQSRGISIIAVLASGLEVLAQLGVLHLQVGRLPLNLILGLGLAVPGLIAWFRSTGKGAVTAGAIATFVGALQVLVYLLPSRALP